MQHSIQCETMFADYLSSNSWDLIYSLTIKIIPITFPKAKMLSDVEENIFLNYF